MNAAYFSTSSSSAQPEFSPPTMTRWSPTPTVNVSGSGSGSRRRNSGICCAELATVKECVQWNAGHLQRFASALVTVDDTQRLDHHGARLSHSVSRGQEGAAGRESVVDQQHAHTGLERRPLDGAAGAA